MFRSLIGALVVSLAATVAHPAEIKIQSLSSSWKVLETKGKARVEKIGTEELRWGRPYPGYDGERSGFRFDVTKDKGPFPVDTLFDVGEFTHLNNVIYKGEYLKKARLNLEMTALFDGIARTFSSSFDITLWETPNKPRICANGEKNGRGVNKNDCADRVQLLNNDTIFDVFTVGTTTYTFEFLGFVNWGRDFWTIEDKNNRALVQARFSAVTNRDGDDDDDDDDDVPPVPLPAGIWGLLGALGALGLIRRARPRV